MSKQGASFLEKSDDDIEFEEIIADTVKRDKTLEEPEEVFRS